MFRLIHVARAVALDTFVSLPLERSSRRDVSAASKAMIALSLPLAFFLCVIYFVLMCGAMRDAISGCDCILSHM